MKFEQMTLADFAVMKPKNEKRLILSLSLTCHKTICPYCKMDNPDCGAYHRGCTGENLGLKFWDSPLDICPRCGKRYDREDPEVRMSRDYAECERLGLRGAVTKDENGKWIEAKF